MSARYLSRVFANSVKQTAIANRISCALGSRAALHQSAPLGKDEDFDFDPESDSDDSYLNRYDVSASWNRPLGPTTPAPNFSGMAVVNKQFKSISLADYKGKWLLLFFYPLDFTFVCPTEITAFSDAADQFTKLNCEVVACSADSQFSHLAWTNMPRKEGGLGDMKIALLSDFKKDIAKDFGVYFEEKGFAFRGLYLIDPDGKVAHVSVNDNAVGRNVDESLRLLKAFQFVKEHGQVCPANWQQGKPTIKPTPADSKEFFSKIQ